MVRGGMQVEGKMLSLVSCIRKLNTSVEKKREMKWEENNGERVALLIYINTGWSCWCNMCHKLGSPLPLACFVYPVNAIIAQYSVSRRCPLNRVFGAC